MTETNGIDRLAAAYNENADDHTDPAGTPAGTGVQRLAAALTTTDHEEK